MASIAAVALSTLPVTSASDRPSSIVGSDAFFNPIKLRPRAVSSRSIAAATSVSVQASASTKEKAVGGLTSAALAAALIIPDVAEAAQPGISPSLKNFLLSIVSGSVVVGVIAGAVISVANFDPVKRT